MGEGSPVEEPLDVVARRWGLDSYLCGCPPTPADSEPTAPLEGKRLEAETHRVVGGTLGLRRGGAERKNRRGRNLAPGRREVNVVFAGVP